MYLSKMILAYVRRKEDMSKLYFDLEEIVNNNSDLLIESIYFKKKSFLNEVIELIVFDERFEYFKNVSCVFEMYINSDEIVLKYSGGRVIKKWKIKREI